MIEIIVIFNILIEKFENEYNVLLNTTLEDIADICDVKIAEAIINVRKGNVVVTPGYDGTYGEIALFTEKKPEKIENNVKSCKQKSLADFIH